MTTKTTEYQTTTEPCDSESSTNDPQTTAIAGFTKIITISDYIVKENETRSLF